MLTRREFLRVAALGTLRKALEAFWGGEIPSYPYISGVGEQVYEIYQVGQNLGNRANAFVKVGDSMTHDSRFLTPIGQGQYDLGDKYGYLESVIEYYKDSFARGSAAVVNGWRAESVLTGKPRVGGGCFQEESPLSCEYRLAKPALAVIMLGTNDAASGIRPADYEKSLRLVIEVSEAGGVIPILTTIPPMNRKTAYPVTHYNDVVRRLALESEVPLIDYWAALQKLPGYGLSSDGVHPWSSYGGAADFSEKNLARAGITVRNLLTLMALDEIWRFISNEPLVGEAKVYYAN